MEILTDCIDGCKLKQWSIYSDFHNGTSSSALNIPAVLRILSTIVLCPKSLNIMSVKTNYLLSFLILLFIITNVTDINSVHFEKRPVSSTS